MLQQYICSRDNKRNKGEKSTYPFNLNLKGSRIITAKNAAEAKDVHQKQHQEPGCQANGDAEGWQHPGGWQG